MIPEPANDKPVSSQSRAGRKIELRDEHPSNASDCRSKSCEPGSNATSESRAQNLKHAVPISVTDAGTQIVSSDEHP
jgi:hypothetical protein